MSRHDVILCEACKTIGSADPGHKVCRQCEGTVRQPRAEAELVAGIQEAIQRLDAGEPLAALEYLRGLIGPRDTN